MTDTEIIETIAKEVMGWKRWNFKDDYDGTYPMYWADGHPGVRYMLHEDDSIQNTWNPLESIADAWMVVEKMMEGGWHFKSCDFLDGGFGFSWYEPKLGRGYKQAEGDTMPRAICMAAIEVVKEKE